MVETPHSLSAQTATSSSHASLSTRSTALKPPEHTAERTPARTLTPACCFSHGGTGIPSSAVRPDRYLMLTVAAIAAAALIAGGGALIFHCLPSAA
jgi:hypothetical protein